MGMGFRWESSLVSSRLGMPLPLPLPLPCGHASLLPQTTVTVPTPPACCLLCCWSRYGSPDRIPGAAASLPALRCASLFCTVVLFAFPPAFGFQPSSSSGLPKTKRAAPFLCQRSVLTVHKTTEKVAKLCDAAAAHTLHLSSFVTTGPHRHTADGWFL